VSDGTGDQDHADQQGAPWGDRRSFADRLFPGPSNPMSKQNAERVQRLLRSRPPHVVPPGSGSDAPARQGGRGTPIEAPPAPGADDVAKLQEALDAQNELLKAILSSTVDSQKDARSTAQNSRTFAWAGTLIALLTLVATVVLIVNGG
jgi:hypothetical protein